MTFEDKLIREFENFDHSRFTVIFFPPKIFLCGGPVDVKSAFPLSLRQRLIEHSAKYDGGLHSACIQAEDFIDYFRDGLYSDLLQFESDIAGIATLIIICLESPGSLVELGLFCMDSETAKKLVIIAPLEQTKKEDSFIFLGPLTNIKQKNQNSILIYPWPSKDTMNYEHIEYIFQDIKSALESSPKSQQFRKERSAHIAFIIHDVIILSNPITITEIELALTALDIDIQKKELTRLLYLLEKIDLISHITYSNVTYYFGKKNAARRVKFGQSRDGRIRDTSEIKLSFREAFYSSEDEQSRKRILVQRQYLKSLEAE